MSDTNHDTTKMTLVGVQFAPTEAAVQQLPRNLASLGQANNDHSKLPPAQFAALPVFEAPDGRRYLLVPGALGPQAIPVAASPAVQPTANELKKGGFVPLESLRTPAGVAAANGPRQQQLDALRAEVVKQVVQSQATGGEPSADKPNLLAGAAQSAAISIGQSLLGAGAAALMKEGNIGGAIDSMLSPQAGGQFLSGLGVQAAGMVTGMLFNSLWSVDDESSTAEAAAHALVGQLIQKIQAEVLGAAFNGTLGELGGSLSAKVDRLFGVPGPNAKLALRLGDVDPKGNKVTTAAGNVFIEGPPAARNTDVVEKTGKKVTQGSSSVFICGLNAARIQLSFSDDGCFAAGASRTYIGGKAMKGLPTTPPVQGVSSASGSGGGPNSLASLINGPSGQKGGNDLMCRADGTGPDQSIPPKYYAQQATTMATGQEGHDSMNPWSPGHAATLIGMEDPAKMMSHYETYGLYPDGMLDNFKDVNGHTQDAATYNIPGTDVRKDVDPWYAFPYRSAPVEITPTQYQAFVDYTHNYTQDYQVWGNNCVDFAVSSYNYAVGVNVFTVGTEYFGIGSPRQLGADIIKYNDAIGLKPNGTAFAE